MRVYLPPVLSLLGMVVFLQTNTAFSQTNFTNYQTVDQIQIDYSDPFVCSFTTSDTQAEYMFLKLTNLSSQAKTISFRIDMYYQGEGCINCANNEYMVTINLPANSSVVADCDLTNGDYRQLAIFKKFVNQTNYRTFDHFELSSITVQ